MQCAWPHEAVLDRTRQRGTNQRGTSQGGTQHRMRRTPADRTRRAYGPNETHLQAGFNTHARARRGAPSSQMRHTYGLGRTRLQGTTRAATGPSGPREVTAAAAGTTACRVSWSRSPEGGMPRGFGPTKSPEHDVIPQGCCVWGRTEEPVRQVPFVYMTSSRSQGAHRGVASGVGP